LFNKHKLASLSMSLLGRIIMNNGAKVLWIVSVGTAFFLGYSSNHLVISEQTTPHRLFEQSKVEDNAAQLKEYSNFKKVNKVENLTTPSMEKPDLNKLVGDLKSFLGGGEIYFDMVSIAKAYGLIENLNKDELLDTLNLMKDDLTKPSNMQLLSLLVGHFASFDPIEAIRITDEFIDSPQANTVAMMSVLSTWVKEDPVSAYYWYVDPNNGHDSNGAYSSFELHVIFNGLASYDANGAFDKLSELGSTGMNINMAVMGFSRSLENKEDFIQFIERSGELDNPNVKNSLISSWVSKRPSEVIEWSQAIEDQEQQNKMQSTIFTTWSSVEPENAANWYIKKASADEKQSHANKIIQMWSMNDPNAALTWLDQQTTFDTEKPITELLTSSTYSNPKFAMDNLERLTNDKDKANISFSIYQSLERISTKKAQEFITSSPYKDEIIEKQQSFEEYNKKRGES